jgi:protein-disulfide isomerase/uncharacterized membrane protein
MPFDPSHEITSASILDSTPRPDLPIRSGLANMRRMTKKRRGKAKVRAAGAARGWRIAFLLLCTVGACLSADLLRLHVNVHTDPDYHSYCAMSARVNCDTVAASDFSVFLGLPVALWGLVGYAGLGALTVWGLRRHRYGETWPLGMAFWLALGCALLGVALYLVSHMVIRSVCVVCAGSYLVNFGLAFMAFMALRRSGSGVLVGLRDDLRSIAAAPRPFLLLAGSVVLIVATAWAAVPPYWRVETSTGPGGLTVGTTEEGHPWIGATEPVLVIEEYSDYQCPHCQRGHGEVRKLIQAHPDRLRLIHRNYPLDQACNSMLKRAFHPDACRYASLAYCAQQQGRFWEANDYLFTHGRRNLPVTAKELASSVGLDRDDLLDCVDADRGRQAIQLDLQAGQALHIRGTPTFVIGGETYPGRVPAEVVESALK